MVQQMRRMVLHSDKSNTFLLLLSLQQNLVLLVCMIALFPANRVDVWGGGITVPVKVIAIQIVFHDYFFHMVTVTIPASNRACS